MAESNDHGRPVASVKGHAPDEGAGGGTDAGRDQRMLGRFIAIVVFFILFAIAETVLWVLALVQFFWMLFNNGERSAGIAEFGRDLSKWLAEVTLFQTGASDERPFPWRSLKD